LIFASNAYTAIDSNTSHSDSYFKRVNKIHVFAFGTHFAISNAEVMARIRRTKMAKEVIRVQGEDQVVREDTAKSFRGVYWALLSLLAFVIIAAILFFGGFLGSATDGVQSPAQIEDAGRN